MLEKSLYIKSDIKGLSLLKKTHPEKHLFVQIFIHTFAQ